MKLLFDHNLSYRLVERLSDLFPDSSHVRIVGLERADDEVIWNYAQEHGFVIVTQDSDFIDWNKIRRAPPKIIWIRCGNQSLAETEQRIRECAPAIETLETDSDLEIVEVW